MSSAPGTMRVVHVLPTLPPRFGGVGDYALALAGALAPLGIESEFLVADPAWRPAADARFPARQLERDADGLARRLEEGGAGVLLHYANYGFARRGCPRWLVQGLARWAARGGGPLVSYFHEVHASGPPWRSSFWLRPVQRGLAARVAAMSDHLLTSLDLYSRILAELAPRTRPELLPMASTVGEPQSPPATADRPRRLALFGSAGVRARAYGPHRAALEAACRRLGIEEVLDIGPPATGTPSEIGGARVVPVGAASADDVSRRLLGARAGFLAYPPDFLPKSTIFAAYCSHGLLPVCAWEGNHRWEGTPPLWRPERSSPSEPERLAAIAAAARDWYRGHALDVHAARIRRGLGRAAAPAPEAATAR